MKAYQIKITIKKSKPPIWRRCIIPAGITFSQLSILLNEIMGWDGYHNFSFHFYHLQMLIFEDIEEEKYYDHDDQLIEASQTLIDDFFDLEDWFTYTYESGDNWDHKVEIEEKIENYPEDYPKVIKYKGDCPIENPDSIKGEYNVEGVNHSLQEDFYVKFGIKDTRLQGDIREAKANGEEGIIATKYTKKSSNRARDKDYGKNYYDDIYDYDLDDLGDIDEEEIKRELEDLFNSLSLGIDYNYVPQSLQSMLLSSYSKNELYELAKIHNLPRKSSYNKKELASALSGYIIRPDIMANYFLLADDKEIEAFELVLRNNYVNLLDFTELEDVKDLNMDYEFATTGGYLSYDEDSFVVYAPVDIASAYEAINTPEFNKKRRRISKMLQYYKVAAELYGSATYESIMNIYNHNEKEKVSVSQVKDMASVFPLNRVNFTYVNNRVVHEIYIQDQNYIELETLQNNLPYYLPNSEEVYSYSKFATSPLDNSTLNLLQYLEDVYGISHFVGMQAVDSAQYVFRHGGNVQDIVDIFDYYDIVIDYTVDVDYISSLIFDVYNNTRRTVNRGYTNNEIDGKR